MVNMKKKTAFSPKDIRQIKALGMSLSGVEDQLAAYRRGPRFLRLIRPCAINDGITLLTPAQRKNSLVFMKVSPAGLNC